MCKDLVRMFAGAGRRWLISIFCFTVSFQFSRSSGTETNCWTYRTGTLGKYKYPMKKLATDITSFNVSVKVMKYAYIALSTVARDTINQYEIAIGNSEKANTAAIRLCRHCEDEKSVTTQYRLLESNEFKQFWVSFKSGTIEIGRYNETAFISWTDLYPLDIRFIGISTGMRLPGDFIFCGLRFDTSQEVSMEGLFVLCVLFLPATLMIIRMYLKHLKRKLKRSNDSSNDTDSFDDFYTTGVVNPTVPQSDPEPPSYDKCMEDGCERLGSVEEGASTSCDIDEYNVELPPSYEAAVGNYLQDMHCDAQSDQTEFNIIRMWDSASVNENADDLETFV